jgi:hypothetical protein
MRIGPLEYSELRKIVATKAWSIWCPSRPLPAVPAEFYNIADVAIREVQSNVDKMITETVKGRLETLLPPDP